MLCVSVAMQMRHVTDPVSVNIQHLRDMVHLHADASNQEFCRVDAAMIHCLFHGVKL